MSVVKCENGHYYDDSKYPSCPHCQSQQQDGFEDDGLTMKLSGQVAADEAVMYIKNHVQHYANVDYDDDKTIGFYSSNKGNDFVTGWLVCIKGPERGRDYQLHNGFNKIGRSRSLDIYLEEDQYISRSPHCAVVYEYKSNLFYVVPQGGNITYLNGQVLSDSKQIVSGDVIEIGESELEFIAFCRGDRKWEQSEAE